MFGELPALEPRYTQCWTRLRTDPSSAAKGRDWGWRPRPEVGTGWDWVLAVLAEGRDWDWSPRPKARTGQD